jgi:hypothetical protein
MAALSDYGDYPFANYQTAAATVSRWYGDLISQDTAYSPVHSYESIRKTPKPKGFIEDLRSEINEWLKDALV